MFSQIYRALKLLNIFLDVFWLNLALILAFYWGVDGVQEYFVQHKILLFLIVVNMLWLLSATVFHLYSQYGEKDSVVLYHQLIKAFLLFLGGILLLAVILLFRDDSFERMSLGPLFYLILCGVFFSALIAIRLLFLGIRKKYRNNSKNREKKKVLVVGGNCFSKELGQRLFQNAELPFEISGVFYNRPLMANDGLNGMYKGNFEEVFPYFRDEKIDEIFCITKGLERPDFYRLMEAADNHVIRLRMLMDVYDYLPSFGQFEVINNIPVFQVRKEPLQDAGNNALKRIFDIAFSSMVIIFLLGWLLPVLAILIKLESKGPVFFKQKRSGKDNHAFTCYKLRSMYVNNDANKVQATKNDHRITKIGAFLRKTSLDELPQFFNVLMGSMSIVGPRPHMLAHTEEYSALVSHYMVRHFLRPGITGWAQVNGSRGETKDVAQMEKRVRLDIWYVENWSFLLDLKIIFLTFWQVVKGDDNAY